MSQGNRLAIIIVLGAVFGGVVGYLIDDGRGAVIGALVGGSLAGLADLIL